ncbi:hypothetical protein SAMN05421664_1941 [Chryseobacterium soldanellicola]|uniref:Uncharacterized protein n=1 Tax=Chryseobacterium soldanellicola TaxID=311333 RepID=A0A1H1BMQ6_9FLAO|nr:hypothetical protein SAMN05421664_1941 [Chryseobacterium soldanellicola]
MKNLPYRDMLPASSISFTYKLSILGLLTNLYL